MGSVSGSSGSGGWVMTSGIYKITSCRNRILSYRGDRPPACDARHKWPDPAASKQAVRARGPRPPSARTGEARRRRAGTLRPPMHVRARLAALSLIVAALAGARPADGASPWSDHDVVAARLIAAGGVEHRRGPERRELRLGLHLRLAPGWHVYWRHPGDAGLPPEVILTADGPLGAPRLLFPAPERYELRGGLVANGYSGEVVYPLRVELPAGAAPPARVTAAVDCLACEDECIPYHDELALELGAPTPDEAELLARWESRLPLPVTERPGVMASAVWRGSAAGGE